ncbi:MAG: DUF5681 domain-containing protein [Sulfuricella sp.]|nr:DUF5681 domain-containing protein [Sulfuricella sp.]
MVTKKSSHWKPGQSGNPAGRKPGSGEIGRLRSAIADELPEIIEKLVAAAKNGDVQAARLLLERAVPSIKATGLPVRLDLPPGDDLFLQGAAAIEAAFRGEIAPDQAAEMLGGLTALAKIREIGDGERHVRSPEEIALDIRTLLAAIEAASGAN